MTFHEAWENSADKGWHISEYLKRKRTTIEIEEAISFREELETTMPAHWEWVLGSLRASKGMTYSMDYSRETPPVRSHCAALIIVMAATANVFDRYHGNIPGVEYENVWFLTDERLVRYLGENPERAHEIAAFVTERYSLDFDLLMTVMDSGAPSLRQGVL
jgi:hypothetical protein